LINGTEISTPRTANHRAASGGIGRAGRESPPTIRCIAIYDFKSPRESASIATPSRENTCSLRAAN